MIAQLVKGWMPRSLYGRSVLIVMVPVMVLLLMVTVVFIQRLYEGVTGQMTEAVAHDGPTLVDVVCQPLEEANAPVRRWMG